MRLGVGVGTEDDEGAGAADAGDLEGHDTDRAGALDDDEVTGFHGGFFDEGVVGDADRFGQRGVLVGDVVGYAVEDLGAGGNIAGHGAVGKGAVAEAVGAKVVVAAEAVDAGVAHFGGGFDGDSVADFPAGDFVADVDDYAGEFVAEDEREGDFPRLHIAPHVDVGAAYAGGFDLDHDLVKSHLGFGDVAYFDFFIAVTVFGNCFHWGDSLYFEPILCAQLSCCPAAVRGLSCDS